MGRVLIFSLLLLFISCRDNSKNVESFNANLCIFSIVVDDLNSTDMSVIEILSKYDIPASFALVTNKLSSSNIASYRNEYLKGGSILSHTINHSSSRKEIIDSKKVLESYGFTVYGYVAPGGDTPFYLLPTIDKYYEYGYTQFNVSKIEPLGDGFVNKFNRNVSKHRLTRVGLEGWNKNIKDCSEIKALVDFAIDNRLLITFYLHQMPSSYTNDDGTSVFTEKNLETLCVYLKEKRDKNLCKVLASDEAVKEYYGITEF